MRIAAITLLFAFPLAAAAQAPLTLKSTPLEDPVLIEVLNGAEMRELNRLPGASHSSLALRLYSVGHSGTCVEETEWVCSYHYVLAVSEYGEAPAEAAFDLGEVGELTNISWLKSNEPFHVLLSVTVRNYPTHAVKQNPALKPQSKRYTLDISLQRVLIAPVR